MEQNKKLLVENRRLEEKIEELEDENDRLYDINLINELMNKMIYLKIN